MTHSEPDLALLFLAFSRNKLLGQYWPRLRETAASLNDEQVWWRPNDASNSIGNLILHLTGNVYQWLVASFNKEDDQRNRPQEFSQRGPIPVGELLDRLGATLARAEAVLTCLTAAELLAPYDIQGYHVCGLEAVYQVVEHFGLHYGQILYIAKSLTGRDLGFYKELTKTGRAS